ncbi:flavin reductase [Nocardia sp. ET3-3]|uniref:Flavin reductase n=1 Tax=Nocardia terrae TaxID=2675851 RepID=A0A7K1USU8_9NOCA|nr:flavin reductase family protein [Nocardia terrae]MVU77351.1 flavin reductase [Nocardia terrae]
MIAGAELRRVLGAFATGITVVTTGGPRPHGMTANAFTSVSLEPPLILVCVARKARLHRTIREAGAFAVSVLSADQEPIARWFAATERPDGAAQFGAGEWIPGPHTAAPMLAGAMAGLECKLADVHDSGDHSIILGEVLAAQRHLDSGPGALAFLDGNYCRLIPSQNGDRSCHRP